MHPCYFATSLAPGSFDSESAHNEDNFDNTDSPTFQVDENINFSSKDMDENDNLFSQRTWGAQWSREPGEQGALVFD